MTGPARPSIDSTATSVYYTPRESTSENADQPAAASPRSSTSDAQARLSSERPRPQRRTSADGPPAVDNARPRQGQLSDGRPSVSSLSRVPEETVLEGTPARASHDDAAGQAGSPARAASPVSSAGTRPAVEERPGGLAVPSRAAPAGRPSTQSAGSQGAASGTSGTATYASAPSFTRSEITGQDVEHRTVAEVEADEFFSAHGGSDVEMGSGPGSEAPGSAQSHGSAAPADAALVAAREYRGRVAANRPFGRMAQSAIGSGLVKFPLSALHTGFGKWAAEKIGEQVPGEAGTGLVLKQAAAATAAGSLIVPALHAPLEKVARAVMEAYGRFEVGKVDPGRAMPGDTRAARDMRLKQKGLLPTEPIGMAVTILGFMLANLARSQLTEEGRWAMLQSGIGGALGTLALVAHGYALKTSTQDEGRQVRVPVFHTKPPTAGESRPEAAGKAFVNSVWSTATGRNPADTPREVRTVGDVFQGELGAKLGQIARELRNRNGLGIALSMMVGGLLLNYVDPTAAQKLLTGPVAESAVYLLAFIGGLKAFGDRKPNEFGTVTSLKKFANPKEATDSAAAVAGPNALVGMGYDAVNAFRSEANQLEVPEMKGKLLAAAELPVRAFAALMLTTTQGLSLPGNLVFDAGRLMRNGDNARASVAALKQDGTAFAVDVQQAMQAMVRQLSGRAVAA